MGKIGLPFYLNQNQNTDTDIDYGNEIVIMIIITVYELLGRSLSKFKLVT